MAEIVGSNEQKTIRRWVPMVLLGAVLFVALNGWMALDSVKLLEKSEKSVDHTWEVLGQVERMVSSAKDAEMASRGYLLTGQDRFLQPYLVARSDLPKELAAFKEMTADNASQQGRAGEMGIVLEQRLALLERGNILRSAGANVDAAQAAALLDSGKEKMDRLRAIADEMEREERRLLADRTRESATAARRARYTLALASALDLLLIVFMFRYFVRERDLRLTAELTAQRLALSRVEVERKAAEIQELNEGLERRVQQRTAELEVANRDLEASNRELEAFSYSVSHDLRAPLRTIDGFSLALEEDYAAAVGAAGKDYIDRVRAAVQRMGGLIDALLQLSRITRTETERETLNLTELAHSVARQLESQHPGQKIEFVIEKGLSADADPKLLRVALENLFDNAVKFSSRKPESKVEFGWDASQKAFFIRDNGAGFDMHYKDKLFNAFNRLHGDRDYKGSGIGLATVARVVRRHHGLIWADSVVNAGATFWFTLG